MVSRGLKTYVLTDESSLSDALGEAKAAEERRRNGLQLDQFHNTFNFCMSCRQYTCGACWNAAEGRCLTCAPMPEMAAAEVIEGAERAEPEAAEPEAAESEAAESEWTAPAVARIELARAAESAAVVVEANPALMVVRTEPAEGVLTADAWPMLDRLIPVSEPEPFVVAAEPEFVVAAEPEAAVELAAEPEAVIAAEPEREIVAAPEPVVAPGPEPVVAPEPDLVVAAEPEPAIELAPEPVVVAKPEPVNASEPEFIVAEEPEPTVELAAESPLEAVTIEPTPAFLADAIVQPELELVAEQPIDAAPEPAVAAADAVVEVVVEPLIEAAAEVATRPIVEAPAAQIAEAPAAPSATGRRSLLSRIAERPSTRTEEPVDPIAMLRQAQSDFDRAPRAESATRAGPTPAPVKAPTPPSVPETVVASPERGELRAAPAPPFTAPPVTAPIVAPAPTIAPPVVPVVAPPPVAAQPVGPLVAPAAPTAPPPDPTPLWWIVAPDGATIANPEGQRPATSLTPGLIAPKPEPKPVPTRPKLFSRSLPRPAASEVRSDVAGRRSPDQAPRAPWPPLGLDDASGLFNPAAIQATQKHDSVWAASSRDVLNRPGSGVQACVGCALPLSVAARFCRRCGAGQP